MKSITSIHDIGVGLRPQHYEQFYEKAPKSVSWVEVISENFMRWRSMEAPAPLRRLLKIRKNVPVSLHGVSMSLGSSDELDQGYLLALKDLINCVEPISVSDHLCWTSLAGKYSHDLLPLPYTEEALAHVCSKIERAQDFLGRQIAVENLSSYVEFSSSEMTEWEFLAEVTRRSGCKLILDINNVYVSSVNHRFNPYTYLQAIRPQSVEHIHLAGHTVKESFLIDTHDQPVSEEVWTLYRWACENLPGPKVMIERDGNIPSWDELEEELQYVATIQKEVRGQSPKSPEIFF